MAQTPDLHQLFDSCVQSIEDMVSSRKGADPYDWIIASGGEGFIPDYFTIQWFGRSFIERGINFCLANHLGRFGVSYKIVSRFVALFYDLPIFQDKRHREWLLQRLRQMPTGMLAWSLVEFFMFMERWMRGVFSLELMSFKAVKAQLNQQAISALDGVDVFDDTSGAFAGAIVAACHANWLDIIVPDMLDRQDGVLSLARSYLMGQQVSVVPSSVIDALGDGGRLIMVECDNSGEVIFDLVVVLKLLLMGHRVVMVAKFAPILNDVTVSDLLDLIPHTPIFSYLSTALQNGTLQVISANNFPMVGKYLPLATNEYQKMAEICDLFWLKGQANFQTMPLTNHGLLKRPIRYRKPVVLNFIVKTPIVGHCLAQSQIGKVKLGDALIGLV